MPERTADRPEKRPHLYERKCPVCKRKFIIRGDWGWTLGNRKYCRYSCMREAEKKRLGEGQAAEQAGNDGGKGPKERWNRTMQTGARTLDEMRAEMVRAHARPAEIRAARLWTY